MNSDSFRSIFSLVFLLGNIQTRWITSAPATSLTISGKEKVKNKKKKRREFLRTETNYIVTFTLQVFLNHAAKIYRSVSICLFKRSWSDAHAHRLCQQVLHSEAMGHSTACRFLALRLPRRSSFVTLHYSQTATTGGRGLQAYAWSGVTLGSVVSRRALNTGPSAVCMQTRSVAHKPAWQSFYWIKRKSGCNCKV